MKTIIEWFEMLPKDIRDKAILNAINYHTQATIEPLTESTLEDAIFVSFDWGLSKEGFDFWENIHERASNGEFDGNNVEKSVS